MPKSISKSHDTQITPDPALEKRTRRRFNAEYKLCIIAEADNCKYGELGSLLRREKLYSSQLIDWRREFTENGVSGLSKSVPGPIASRTPDTTNSATPTRSDSPATIHLLTDFPSSF